MNWNKIIGWSQVLLSGLAIAGDVIQQVLQVALTPGFVPGPQGYVIMFMALANALSGIHKVAKVSVIDQVVTKPLLVPDPTPAPAPPPVAKP